ncbi:hypothetical protein [Devosia sp. DBB001]|nr:hypothetical protein [Devosia sp. DBB001]
MTVEEANDDYVGVIWFDDKEIKRANLGPDILEIIEDER